MPSARTSCARPSVSSAAPTLRSRSSQLPPTMDIWYVPDPARAALRRARPDRRARGRACQFEPFHDTPGPAELRGCVRKQLHWHHELERRAGGAVPFRGYASSAAAGPPPCSTRSASAPGRPAPRPGAPRRVADRPRCHRRAPRTRAPCCCACSARGRAPGCHPRARRLPEDAWERGIALPWLVRFARRAPAEPSARTAEDAEEEEIVTEVQQWFEQLKRIPPRRGAQGGPYRGTQGGPNRGTQGGPNRGDGRRGPLRRASGGPPGGAQGGPQEGRKEGLQEGQLRVLARQFEKKPGRPLTEMEPPCWLNWFERLVPIASTMQSWHSPSGRSPEQLADPTAR